MQFPVSNNFTVVVKILKMLINNCGKKKKKASKLRQDNLLLYQLMKKLLCTFGNRESTKKDKTLWMPWPYKKFNGWNGRPIISCKDKGRNRSKHCWQDNSQKMKFRTVGQKVLFSQLILLLPWQFRLLLFRVESMIIYLLIPIQSNLLSLIF